MFHNLFFGQELCLLAFRASGLNIETEIIQYIGDGRCTLGKGV